MSDIPLPKVTQNVELNTTIEKALFNIAIIRYLYHVRDTFAFVARDPIVISADIEKWLINYHTKTSISPLLSFYNVSTVDALELAKIRLEFQLMTRQIRALIANGKDINVIKTQLNQLHDTSIVSLNAIKSIPTIVVPTHEHTNEYVWTHSKKGVVIFKFNPVVTDFPIMATISVNHAYGKYHNMIQQIHKDYPNLASVIFSDTIDMIYVKDAPVPFSEITVVMAE
jgi:hypothetical protein